MLRIWISFLYLLVDWYIFYDGVRLTSQNCSLFGPIVHSRVTAMWTMVWWYRLRLTPNSFTRALWQPLVLSYSPVSRDISGASKGMVEGNANFVCPSSLAFKRSLTCHKFLRHGTFGLLPIWKKVCCGFLSPLKIHRLGLVRTRDLWIQWQAH
jgi:hypothetical protein